MQQMKMHLTTGKNTGKSAVIRCRKATVEDNFTHKRRNVNLARQKTPQEILRGFIDECCLFCYDKKQQGISITVTVCSSYLTHNRIGGDDMKNVTYSELFQLCTLIVSIINLVLLITR